MGPIGFFKKYPFEIITAFIILFIFFLTRFYNIMSLPIFTDEAIYIRWAQIASQDANWRFISLTDGKQPLFIWFTMTAMKFIDDPLLAGRVVSVGAGFSTIIGLFFLGRELFRNYKIGLIAASLYVAYPFALVYDKIALYDSLVATLAVWAVYFQVLLVRRIRLDIALILGLVMGAGVLNKTIGFTSVYLFPLGLLLFSSSLKDKRGALIQWGSLAILSTFLTYLYYSILRLSPFFHIITEKNAIFIYPLREWVKHPFDFFLGNLLSGQWNWLNTYMTYPILLLIILSFFISRRFFKEKVFLFLWFLIPFVGLALFGKTLYPRFIFFMTLFLLPLASYTLYEFSQRIKNIKFTILLSAFFLLLMLRIDFYLLTNFAKAPIPFSDVAQYNNDWPSGTGVRESVAFFKEQAEDKKIFVATEGTFGLMPFAYEIYLSDNPNITIKGYWPIEEMAPREVLQKAKEMPVYVVFYQHCSQCSYAGKGIGPSSWPMKVVLQVKKAAPDAYLTVYQILPQ